MKTAPEVQILELYGSPLERGRIHGEVLRSKIREYISGWKNTLGEVTGTDPDAYIGAFLDETDFRSAISKWTPDLLDEVQGIAEGSGIDWKTIFAHQLGDEEWWYRRQRRWSKLDSGHQGPAHCTAMGVFGERYHAPLLAQTWDMPEYVDGYQVLLHIKHAGSELESFVITIAGVIAANGLNNHAVGVCVNTLLQLDHRVDGLPVDFVVRGILAQSTLEDAIAFVRRVNHASGQNYMIGGPERIVDFEASANQARQYIFSSGLGHVCHTNHPIINDDLAMYRAALNEAPAEEKEARAKREAHSRARFDSVAKQLSETSETITLEKVKTVLSSHEAPVCCHKGRDTTVTAGCLIMELSELPILTFAPGPPCSTPFEAFIF